MADRSINHHIAAISSRSHAEGDHLTARLVRDCWPGGLDDGIEPAALGWVRRWRPARAGAALRACSCSGGHCTVCN